MKHNFDQGPVFLQEDPGTLHHILLKSINCKYYYLHFRVGRKRIQSITSIAYRVIIDLETENVVKQPHTTGRMT